MPFYIAHSSRSSPVFQVMIQVVEFGFPDSPRAATHARHAPSPVITSLLNVRNIIFMEWNFRNFRNIKEWNII